MKRCYVREGGGRSACGHETTTISSTCWSYVTCGNCKRTKAYREAVAADTEELQRRHCISEAADEIRISYTPLDGLDDAEMECAIEIYNTLSLRGADMSQTLGAVIRYYDDLRAASRTPSIGDELCAAEREAAE